MRLTQIVWGRLSNKVGDLTKRYANFPDSYIQRSMEQVYWKTPNKPNYLKRTVERKNFRFTTNRPWTSQFQQQNLRGRMRKKVFVEPIETWSYFRGDRVEILVGRDKGKHGIISQVLQERNWVIVEGLNCHLRRVGRTDDYPGAIVKSEAPLLVTTDIALVDPSDLQITEFEWRYTEEGDKVRVSLRTGRIIPLPINHYETMDYKSKSAYIERDKDTKGKIVSEITFKPALQTFEMDIMNQMGIVETRLPKKTFWY